MTDTVTVAIIGTCGRTQGDRLEPETFDFMCSKARTAITDTLGLDPSTVELVSGGAAWADHVAVQLFNEEFVSKLTLHLPVALEATKFHTNNTYSFKTNPGYSANKYHKSFSEITSKNSIAELHQAIESGASVQVHQGFHARNKVIAQAEFMIAFTWGEGDYPAKGGTSHTWKHCRSTSKTHISLSNSQNKRKAETALCKPDTKRQKTLVSFFENVESEASVGRPD